MEDKQRQIGRLEEEIELLQSQLKNINKPGEKDVSNLRTKLSEYLALTGRHYFGKQDLYFKGR
jgi:prefoldin subunit 5